MNNYVKPVIRLAQSSGARGVSSCMSEADMELIQSIVGGADADKTFGMTEECEIQIPLEMYCKFTSAELGATQIFWS